MIGKNFDPTPERMLCVCVCARVSYEVLQSVGVCGVAPQQVARQQVALVDNMSWPKALSSTTNPTQNAAFVLQHLDPDHDSPCQLNDLGFATTEGRMHVEVAPHKPMKTASR